MSGTKQQIGFIGLGRMGLPMASRLAALDGYDLTTFDVGPARCPGAAAAGSVAELASRARCVFTCLPSEAVVRAVYLGPDGLFANSGSIEVTCDFSTISPELAVELAAVAAQAGIRHVEAPMIGGVPEATGGTLFLAAAADGAQSLDDLPAPLPALLPTLSRKTMVVGAPGTAARMKVVQNGLGLVQLVGIAEALATCRRIGIDPRLFADFVIEAKGMAGRVLFAETAPKMLDAPEVSTASVAVAAKDSRLFADLSAALGNDLVSQAAAEQMARAAAAFGDADYTQIIRLFDASERD